MKTCKDCIYYDQTGPTCGQCCLNPKAIEIDDDRYHWCGQLKEKVHVISDEWERSERAKYE